MRSYGIALAVAAATALPLPSAVAADAVAVRLARPAAGDRVRIVDIEGNCLKVEPEHVLPPA